MSEMNGDELDFQNGYEQDNTHNQGDLNETANNEDHQQGDDGLNDLMTQRQSEVGAQTARFDTYIKNQMDGIAEYKIQKEMQINSLSNDLKMAENTIKYFRTQLKEQHERVATLNATLTVEKQNRETVLAKMETIRINYEKMIEVYNDCTERTTSVQKYFEMTELKMAELKGESTSWEKKCGENKMKHEKEMIQMRTRLLDENDKYKATFEKFENVQKCLQEKCLEMNDQSISFDKKISEIKLELQMQVDKNEKLSRELIAVKAALNESVEKAEKLSSGLDLKETELQNVLQKLQTAADEIISLDEALRKEAGNLNSLTQENLELVKEKMEALNLNEKINLEKVDLLKAAEEAQIRFAKKVDENDRIVESKNADIFNLEREMKSLSIQINEQNEKLEKMASEVKNLLEIIDQKETAHKSLEEEKNILFRCSEDQAATNVELNAKIEKLESEINVHLEKIIEKEAAAKYLSDILEGYKTECDGKVMQVEEKQKKMEEKYKELEKHKEEMSKEAAKTKSDKDKLLAEKERTIQTLKRKLKNEKEKQDSLNELLSKKQTEIADVQSELSSKTAAVEATLNDKNSKEIKLMSMAAELTRISAELSVKQSALDTALSGKKQRESKMAALENELRMAKRQIVAKNAEIEAAAKDQQKIMSESKMEIQRGGKVSSYGMMEFKRPEPIATQFIPQYDSDSDSSSHGGKFEIVNVNGVPRLNLIPRNRDQHSQKSRPAQSQRSLMESRTQETSQSRSQQELTQPRTQLRTVPPTLTPRQQPPLNVQREMSHKRKAPESFPVNRNLRKRKEVEVNEDGLDDEL